MSHVTTPASTLRERRSNQVTARAAAAGFLAIAVFQSALALGAPLGRAAWGGGQAQLPDYLRVASASAAGLWLLAALIVLGRAGFRVVPLPAGFVRRGTWILVGLLPIGALMNFASTSRWERLVWGPVALTLAVLCLIVARSESGSNDR